MVVADFGAGSGHYVLHMAEQLRGSGRVYAIDVQQVLLRRISNEAVQRGFKNVETIHGDVARARGSKLADRCLDLVLISNLLFQLEEPVAALKEAWRVLKPTGRLAIIDWSDSLPTGRQAAVRRGPTKAHVVKKERALERAQTGRFEFVNEFAAGAHHYGLVFRLARKTGV